MTKSATVLALASARAEVSRLLALAKSEREAAKTARVTAKAERIAKLQAKLLALTTPKVGVKAVKANRRPSKAIVTKGAATAVQATAH